ncbi:MAG: ECF transporter S component [Clostridia bacterium]|nr:ECF transporter S component [Clostridia bacterium]
MATQNTSRTRQMVQLAILTAITLILSFTPLGYLRIGILSITFIPVPVVIGAILLGPGGGLFLGCVFGLTSFAQCFGMDPFGTALMSLNPGATFVMCVLSRALMGLLSAYVYRLLSGVLSKAQRGGKNRMTPVAYAVASASAPLFNTLFFMSLLYLFFNDAQVVLEGIGDLPFFAFVFSAGAINAVCELLASLVIGTAVCMALDRARMMRRF